MKNSTHTARGMLIFSMVLFGTIGVFVRHIPLPSSVIALVRGFVGMGLLLVVLLARRSCPDVAAIRRNLPVLLLSGTCIGINWILLFESYRYTTVATATLCYYLAPVFVMLLSPLVLRERLSFRKAICIAVALAGMVLVSGVLKGEQSSPTAWKGILFGVGAAIFYASVILLNKFLRDISAYDRTIMQLGTAAVVLLPYVLVTEDVGSLTCPPLGLALLVVVGVLHTGVAYAVYFASMRDLPTQTIALFSYIDPIVAILLSAFFLGESMDLMSIIGAVLILGATLVSELE